MTETKDEKQLLKELTGGVSNAFRELYLRYYDRLYQFAVMFLSSEMAAEDIVENVFYNVWKNRETIGLVSNFQAYLYQAVRNGCINVLKSGYVSRKDEMPQDYLQVTVATDSPLDELTYKELHAAVQKAVNSLPTRCRLVFKMAKEDGMSQQEIADALNVQLSTVQRQIFLAKKKIKIAIKPYLEKKNSIHIIEPVKSKSVGF